jgi:secreted PhoX family phosphatase
MSTLDRRKFLARGAALTGSAAMSSMFLSTLATAGATPSPAAGSSGVPGGYGPLVRVPDQNGDEVLALPEGFTYVTFSRTGDLMADGTPTPRAHDGMGAFQAPDGSARTLLIRNHEVRTAPGTVLNAVQAPESVKYDPLGVGGTVSVLFDTRTGEMVRDWVSFAGSTTNCAGGLAYRNAGWITCEETTAGPNQGWAKKHGYAYLVTRRATTATASVPLTRLGRFAHEAVAVDPANGVIYQTEDSGDDSGFYRFLPNDPTRPDKGGQLQMLAVKGNPHYNTKTGQTVGAELPVQWVRIEDPDPDLEGGALEVARQGGAKGAALFNRLEGIWYDRRSGGFFFVSTSGGDAGFGQVWYYDARENHLALWFESPGGSVLDSPDNLLVTPRGGVVLCEDNASPLGGGGHPLAPGIEDVNRVVGLSRDGQPFEFALNTLSDAEFCGACFSPDATTLFVNIQGDGAPGSGLTAAITGPWARGPL